MRIASIEVAGRRSYGIVADGRVTLAPDSFTHRFPDLKSVLAAGALSELYAAARSAPRTGLSDVRFLPVIPNPGKILCVGINFVTHIREMGRDLPERPWLFVRFADSQTGHERPLVRPAVSDQFDYEGELAVLIGRSAWRVRASDALACVAGYSCYNDGSVRDFQRHSTQFTAGKNFLDSGSFGPWMVSADEIPDPGVLSLVTRLNGAVMQSTGLDDLLFDVPALIEYITTFTRLEPGDVIVTGTPGGVGVARSPQVFMQPGDVVEVEISRIGTLRNTVIDESDSGLGTDQH